MTISATLVKSKVLKQNADVTTYTTINSLVANIYKDGITLTVASIINEIPINDISFLSIQTDQPSSGYWIDTDDGNKLKQNGKLCNGAFRLVASNLPTSGIDWTNIDKGYNVVNGVPINYLKAGTYLDMINQKSVTIIGLLGTAINTENGVYYRMSDNKLWNITGGIGSCSINLNDDTYKLYAPDIPEINGFIYDTNNGVLNLFNGKFINKSDDTYYDNQESIGHIAVGSIFFCDDKILVRTNNGYRSSVLI